MAGFEGTERFQVVRRLGVGGMGEVYEVFDQRRDLSLALKVLRRDSLYGISQLKREFRAVANLRHPSLVTLYDLYVEPKRVFFTMEIVRGRELRHILLGNPLHAENEKTLVPQEEADTQILTQSASSSKNTSTSQENTNSPPDKKRRFVPISQASTFRLLELLSQLLGALDLLHHAGKVHRDIKPHHLLVNERGTLKLLDFGLLTNRGQNETEEVEGTPTYMAPETITGQQVGPEADMYALGVVLYELFSGNPPFTGSVEQILAGHRQSIPSPLENPAARLWQPLIFSLLSKNSNKRPGARQLARQLSKTFDIPEPSFVRQVSYEPVFVGRARERSLMHEASLEAKKGSPRAVIVVGASGSGKTALVREVSTRLEREGWHYFSSRCFEREAVPFRAFDALLEDLAAELLGRKTLPLSGIHGDAIYALLQLFPSLKQVPTLVTAATQRDKTGDPYDVRRFGMRTLASLLKNLSREQPILLELDDLHWADKESLELLGALFDARLSLLVFATSWEEGLAPTHRLRKFLAEYRPPKVRQIRLGALSVEELKEMARGGSIEVTTQTLQRVHQESAGAPYWAWELLRHSKEEAHDVALTLGKILVQRVQELGEKARAVLDVIAVSGGRTSFALLEQVSKIPAEELARTLDELVRCRLLREAHGADGQDGYVSYHERIRARVYESLSSKRQKALHLAIAEGIEKLGEVERFLGTCAEHWHLAGQDLHAAKLALRAAQKARETFALESASDLFSRAIEWTNETEIQLVAEEGKGEVLDKLGRGEEAAKAFERAASYCSGEKSASLRILALDAALRATDSIEQAHEIREVITDLENTSAPWKSKLTLTALSTFSRTTSLAFLGRDIDLTERYFEEAELQGDQGHQGFARVIASYVLGMRGDDSSRNVATTLLEEAASLLPASKDPLAPALRGMAWGQLRLASGEHLAAAGAFGEVVKLLKDKGHATSRLLALASAGQARALWLTGDVRNARTVLEPLVEPTSYPELRAAHLHIVTALAPLWALLGETEGAFALLELVSDWIPDNPGSRIAFLATLCKAELELYLGNYQKARDSLAPLLEDKLWGLGEQPCERAETILLLTRATLSYARIEREKNPDVFKKLLQENISVLADPLENLSRRLHGEALYLVGISKALLSGPEAGLLWLDRAVPILESYGGPITLASTLRTRGLLRKQAQVPGAADDIAQGHALLEAIGIRDPAVAQGFATDPEAELER